MAKDTEKTDRAEKREQEKAQRASRRPNRKDVPDEATIKLLVDSNPRREGTEPYKHFEKYSNGMTVGDLLSEGMGGQWVHLQADVERGYVEIVKP